MMTPHDVYRRCEQKSTPPRSQTHAKAFVHTLLLGNYRAVRATKTGVQPLTQGRLGKERLAMVPIAGTPQERRDRYLKLAIRAEITAVKFTDPKAKAACIDLTVSWMMMASEISENERGGKQNVQRRTLLDGRDADDKCPQALIDGAPIVAPSSWVKHDVSGTRWS
jgi:hypothetical protein